VFPANKFLLSAETIAALYKARCEIELFFNGCFLNLKLFGEAILLKAFENIVDREMRRFMQLISVVIRDVDSNSKQKRM
jgi:IS4 transposase